MYSWVTRSPMLMPRQLWRSFCTLMLKVGFIRGLKEVVVVPLDLASVLMCYRVDASGKSGVFRQSCSRDRHTGNQVRRWWSPATLHSIVVENLLLCDIEDQFLTLYHWHFQPELEVLCPWLQHVRDLLSWPYRSLVSLLGRTGSHTYTADKHISDWVSSADV